MTNWRRQVNEARAQLNAAYARKPVDVDAAGAATAKLRELLAAADRPVEIPIRYKRDPSFGYPLAVAARNNSD